MQRSDLDTESLAVKLTSGSSAALAKAITMAESTLTEHRKLAESLLKLVFPKAGKALRIAVSGPPGVGKSSFIEAFGLHLISQGKRVAVLAIDPTSPITGGSILGDKTRMNELAVNPKAYIRPSPSLLAAGGVGRRTFENIILCEAGGSEVVLIETVGVGQSEFLVRSMTDFFIQLHQPRSGDELQGMKKGINEISDLIIVTKADGTLKEAADIARTELIASSQIKGTAMSRVLTVSSVEKRGFAEVWDALIRIYSTSVNSGEFEKRRKQQMRNWFLEEVKSDIYEYLQNDSSYQAMLNFNLKKLESRETPPSVLAREFVESFFLSIAKNDSSV